MYADIETLFQTTLDWNPQCWMAPTTSPIPSPGRGGSTRPSFIRKALEIKPDYVEGENNLGLLLARRGRLDEAIAHYRRALEIEPDHISAHNNLGVALAGSKRVDEAITEFRKALEIKPNDAEIHYNLGGAGRPRRVRGGHRPFSEGPGTQARLCPGPQQPGRRTGPPRTAGRSHRALPEGPGNPAQLCRRRNLEAARARQQKNSLGSPNQ